MAVTINGKQSALERELTVRELLKKAHAELQGYVTVQVNDEILRRESFGSAAIRDGDRVEFLYYTGGGC